MKTLLKRRHVYVQKHKRSRMRRRVTSLGISFTILLAGSCTAAAIANARRRDEPKLIAPKSNPASTGETPHVSKPTSKKSNENSTSVKSAEVTKPETLGAVTVDCTPKKAANPMLASSTDNQIRKLAEYDAARCSGSISTSLIFTGIPASNAEADEMAQDISAKLKSFAAAGISPYVIVEPTSAGNRLDLENLISSGAGSVYDYFLTTLKAKDISDKEAGTWIFFPEPNIPEWSTLDPAVFTSNYTTFGTLFKEYFKSAKLGILLDSTTYHVNNYDSSGSHESLLPYISGIPAGMVDVFGYQGFPWTPPANETGPATTDAAEFIKPSLAIEAARALGVKEIWLNTGSFATFYANNSAKTVKLNSSARASVLATITKQVEVLQNSGFSVALNIFAEDKSGTKEAVDWSYHPEDKGEMTTVFTNFANNLHELKVELGVFDTY